MKSNKITTIKQYEKFLGWMKKNHNDKIYNSISYGWIFQFTKKNEPYWNEQSYKKKIGLFNLFKQYYKISVIELLTSSNEFERLFGKWKGLKMNNL